MLSHDFTESVIHGQHTYVQKLHHTIVSKEYCMCTNERSSYAVAVKI